MGDYNISCFISGLSIGYDDMYYIIPLTKNVDYKQRNTPERMYDLFRPATLPILCKYDNCGHGDIIENDHTRFLEKRFKAPIAKIVDDCSRVNFDNFCYVHAGIYDAMQQYFRSYDGKKEQMYNFEKEFDKYIQFYRKKIEDNRDTIRSYKKHNSEDLKKYIKQSIEAIRNLDFYHSNSDCIYLSLRHIPELEKLYLTRILKGDFHTELLSFIKFNMHMYSISKQYIPSPRGEQYGNVYFANAVLNATKKIVSAKIKRDKENRI